MTDLARVTLDVAIREMVADDLAGFHDWYGYERDESFQREYAATAFGKSSGPVTPPVGPPPRRCGSRVAKPS